MLPVAEIEIPQGHVLYKASSIPEELREWFAQRDTRFTRRLTGKQDGRKWSMVSVTYTRDDPVRLLYRFNNLEVAALFKLTWL